MVKVDDTYAEIELAPGMKVKAVKSTITDVVAPRRLIARERLNQMQDVRESA